MACSEASGNRLTHRTLEWLWRLGPTLRISFLAATAIGGVYFLCNSLWPGLLIALPLVAVAVSLFTLEMSVLKIKEIAKDNEPFRHNVTEFAKHVFRDKHGCNRGLRQKAVRSIALGVAALFAESAFLFFWLLWWAFHIVPGEEWTFVIVFGAVSGSAYGVTGVAFATVYSVSRFFSMAHGAIVAIGAYAAWACFCMGVPAPVCAVAGAGTAAAIGLAIQLMVHRPLGRRGASGLIQLIASLGLFVSIVAALSQLFGSDTRVLLSGPQPTTSLVGAPLTAAQLATILVALVVWVCILVGLRTRWGKTFRAAASNPELACTLGIPIDRIRLWGFVLASGLAGAAGVLLAMDTGLTPQMGFRPLMMGAVAAIVAGLNRLQAIVLSGILLGVLMQFVTRFLSTGWQDGIVFALLLVFLLFKPEGLSGRSTTKATA